MNINIGIDMCQVIVYTCNILRKQAEKQMAIGRKVTQILIDGKDITSDYFDGFNWGLFNYNDDVFLEDCDETPLSIGRFIKLEIDTIHIYKKYPQLHSD
jgi:hypothetical protein